MKKHSSNILNKESTLDVMLEMGTNECDSLIDYNPDL